MDLLVLIAEGRFRQVAIRQNVNSDMLKNHKGQRRMDSHEQWLWKTGRSWKVRHRQCMERPAPDIRVLSFYEVFRGSFFFQNIESCIQETAQGYPEKQAVFRF